MEGADPVAAGVIRDAVRKVSAHVLDAEAIDEELAQLVNPGHKGSELIAERFISQFVEEHGILIADHGHAG